MAVGMFGNPRGLFANPTTQPLGPQYGQDPMQTAPGAIPNGVPMAPASAAADPSKLTLLDKLGMAGGIISRNYGGQDGVTDTIQQRMQQAYAQRQYQQHLQDTQTQWLGQQEYKRTHPEPLAPDEFDRAAERAGLVRGTPQYLAAAQGALQAKVDPLRAIPYSGPEGEGLMFKHSSELGGASPAPSGAKTPSPAAIAALAAHPEKAAEFDAYYGAGASKQYTSGGAASGGAGTFPLYPARR